MRRARTRASPRYLLEPAGSFPAPPPPPLPRAWRLCSTAPTNRGLRLGRTARLDWAGRARSRPSRGQGRPLSLHSLPRSGGWGGVYPAFPAAPLAIPWLRALPSRWAWRGGRAGRWRRWRDPWLFSASGPAATRSARKTVTAARCRRGLHDRWREGRQGGNMARPFPPPCAHPALPPPGKGLALPPASLSPEPLGARGGGGGVALLFVRSAQGESRGLRHPAPLPSVSVAK